MERLHEKGVKIHCHENVQCINILNPAKSPMHRIPWNKNEIGLRHWKAAAMPFGCIQN